jgi:hypothetical protein
VRLRKEINVALCLALPAYYWCQMFGNVVTCTQMHKDLKSDNPCGKLMCFP